MLEQADGLGLHELVDHVAQNGANGVEPLISMTDVRQPGFVEEDLLDNEDSNRFR